DLDGAQHHRRGEQFGDRRQVEDRVDGHRDGAGDWRAGRVGVPHSLAICAEVDDAAIARHQDDGAGYGSRPHWHVLVQPLAYQPVDRQFAASRSSRPASSAGSTLPPETTATVCPRMAPGTLSAAATATAPPGSATRRASVASRAMAARMSGSVTVTTSSTSW